MQLLMG